ncbi:GNAT family N-acetyltransferase [Acetobacteraceae bacterium ESL0709]|nr:GNAT family N-acetyltransferase [Acetobacteraceae bacterium ESL0697]MDF7678637.1 GNAT family N-acetyltransferase [Acetobacteraceae bacterium ESL0709]
MDKNYDVTFVECSLQRHGEAILAIFNEVLLNSTALYDYRVRTMETMVTWFAAKEAGGFPIIGLEDAEGELVAFGSYGTFRAFPAYKYTVEHSIYVRSDQRGRGLGRMLLCSLMERAQQHNVHAMIGGIDASNKASIRLHEALGFRHVGTLPEVGYKFGRWLDLAFYQRNFATPVKPEEG